MSVGEPRLVPQTTMLESVRLCGCTRRLTLGAPLGRCGIRQRR